MGSHWTERLTQPNENEIRVAREYEVYGRVSRGISITREEVIVAWNSTVNPQHYEKNLPNSKHLKRLKSIL